MSSRANNRPAHYRKRAGSTYGWRCHWCRQPLLDPSEDDWLIGDGIPPGFAIATLEHLIPQSAGGGNQKDNLRLACPSCNVGRGEWRRGIKGSEHLLSVLAGQA